MPVNVFSDSVSMLVNHWQLLSGIVFMILLGQILLWSVLRILFGDKLTADEYISLIASGWILPLFLASLFWMMWGRVEPFEMSGLVLLLIMAILAIALLLRSRRAFVPGSNIVVFMLLTMFGAFLFLRLAFLSKVIFPLYFDSAQHYWIVKNLLRGFPSAELTSYVLSINAYYHVGFHLLTAFTAHTLKSGLIESMLILGQVVVAVIPFSIFPIVKQETQSASAGLFAVLLAAFGWYMPAYAVNWGKYPALTSLPLLTFVLSLAYLSLRYKDVLPRKNDRWLGIILFLAIFSTALAHSRSLIVLAVTALAWILVTGWQKLSRLLHVVTFLAVIAGIILVILYIRTKDVFDLLFDPYWERGLLVTVPVLVLALFALWVYPRLTLASLLIIFFLLGSLLIPIQVPGYGRSTLLDRPFVEMILYLPLSFLGGAGLAGLEKSLLPLRDKWPYKRFWPAPYLSSLPILLLLIYAAATYNFYPAGCCSIVGRDDLVAIDWMDKNLPPDARIAISSTELRVIDSDASQGVSGGDAGIWINPLTDRVTVLIPYQSDFSQPATFNTLCRKGAGYLYVGETGTTFNNGLLTAYPNWYRVLLSMPTAKVYQVVGCPEQPASKPSSLQ